MQLVLLLAAAAAAARAVELAAFATYASAGSERAPRTARGRVQWARAAAARGAPDALARLAATATALPLAGTETEPATSDAFVAGGFLLAALSDEWTVSDVRVRVAHRSKQPIQAAPVPEARVTRVAVRVPAALAQDDLAGDAELELEWVPDGVFDVPGGYERDGAGVEMPGASQPSLRVSEWRTPAPVALAGGRIADCRAQVLLGVAMTNAGVEIDSIELLVSAERRDTGSGAAAGTPTDVGVETRSTAAAGRTERVTLFARSMREAANTPPRSARHWRAQAGPRVAGEPNWQLAAHYSMQPPQQRRNEIRGFQGRIQGTERGDVPGIGRQIDDVAQQIGRLRSQTQNPNTPAADREAANSQIADLVEEKQKLEDRLATVRATLAEWRRELAELAADKFHASFSSAVLFGDFAPHAATPLWPPPAGSELVGLELRFERSLLDATDVDVQDDPSRIGVVVNGTLHRLPLATGDACSDGKQAMWSAEPRRNVAHYGAPADLPFTPALHNKLLSPDVACSLGVQLALRLRFHDIGRPADYTAASLQRAVGRVQLDVTYRTSAPLSPPAPPPVSERTFKASAGALRGAPAAALAVQQGSPMAALAAYGVAAAGRGAPFELVFDAFSLAALPADVGALTQLAVRIEHALIDGGDVRAPEVTFDRVELRRGTTLLATALDVAPGGECSGAAGNPALSSVRMWTGTGCDGAATLSTAVFMSWSAPVAPDDLRACDLSVHIHLNTSANAYLDSHRVRYDALTRDCGIAVNAADAPSRVLVGGVGLHVRYASRAAATDVLDSPWIDAVLESTTPSSLTVDALQSAATFRPVLVPLTAAPTPPPGDQEALPFPDQPVERNPGPGFDPMQFPTICVVTERRPYLAAGASGFVLDTQVKSTAISTGLPPCPYPDVCWIDKQYEIVSFGRWRLLGKPKPLCSPVHKLLDVLGHSTDASSFFYPYPAGYYETRPTIAPTPAPTAVMDDPEDAVPTLDGVFGLSASFPDLADALPPTGAVLRLELRAARQWTCEGAAECATETGVCEQPELTLCGAATDVADAWTVPGAPALAAACPTRRVWPAGARAFVPGTPLDTQMLAQAGGSLALRGGVLVNSTRGGRQTRGSLERLQVRAVFELSPGTVPDVARGCFARTRRDGTTRVAALESRALPPAAFASLWIRAAAPVPDDDGETFLVLLTFGSALELALTADGLELRVGTAGGGNAAGEPLVRVPLVVDTTSGAFQAIAVGWNATSACVFAGAAQRTERAACADSEWLSSAATIGRFAVGGSGGGGGGQLDFDTLLVFDALPAHSARARGWYRRDNPALLLAATLDDDGDDGECPCGAFESGDFAVSNIDCHAATCAGAPVVDELPFTTAGAAGLLPPIASSDFAARAAQACDRPVDSAAVVAAVYRVTGTGGWLTMSTCGTATRVDTVLMVVRNDGASAVCGAANAALTCAAFNDKALRGPTLCGSGASEVSIASEAGVEYAVVVLVARDAGATEPAAMQRESFALTVAGCDEFRCGVVRSCLACDHLASPTSPQRTALRAVTALDMLAENTTLLIEERCVGAQCEGELAEQVRVPVQRDALADVAAARVAAAADRPPLVFERANVRIEVRGIVVTPAVFGEPDFSALGDDNAAFERHHAAGGAGSLDAARVLAEQCAHPLPARYTISALPWHLPRQPIETTTTCAPAAADDEDESTTTRTNELCDGESEKTTKVRCDFRALPDLPSAAVDLARTGPLEFAVCRPDRSLPGVERGIASLVVTTTATDETDANADGDDDDDVGDDDDDDDAIDIVDAALEEESAVDCNVPPSRPAAFGNCSTAVRGAFTDASSVAGAGASFLRGIVSNGERGSGVSLADLREAAACEARAREAEALDKLTLAVARDCAVCSTGAAVAISLRAAFEPREAVHCFAQLKQPTALQARLRVTIGDEVAFDDVLVPVSSDGVSGKLSVLGAAFDFVDPPTDILMRSSADTDVELARPPNGFVPFAAGATSTWANDSCLRVPVAFASDRAPEWQPQEGSVWQRLPAGALSMWTDRVEAERERRGFSAAASRVASVRVGAAAPVEMSALWQFFGAATDAHVDVRVRMPMGGNLLVGGLAPRGKVDESSVSATIAIRNGTNAGDDEDTVRIVLRGNLFNSFNKTEAAYSFGVQARDASGDVVGRWDVLQRGSSRFALEFEATFGNNATAATLADAFVLEISDVSATFAVKPSVNATDVALYEAEKVQRSLELDKRLYPLIYFLVAVPLLGGVMWTIGLLMQKRDPINDDDLYPRHIVVIVFYVAIRVVRSILFTTTVFSIILTVVTQERVDTLRQLPTWIETVSNASSDLTSAANGALDRELVRQADAVALMSTRCDDLLETTQARQRAARAAVARHHAAEMDARNIGGLQEQLALKRQAEQGARADAALEQSQLETFCWKRFTTDVFNASIDFSDEINAKIGLNFDVTTARFRGGVNLPSAGVPGANIPDVPMQKKWEDFRKKVRGFRSTLQRIKRTAKSTYDGFSSLISAVSDADFLDLFDLPSIGHLAIPDVDYDAFLDKIAGDIPKLDWELFPPNKESWQNPISLPKCPCEGGPQQTPAQEGDVSVAARNYTAFGPADEADELLEQTFDAASPAVDLTLRSFVQLPVLFDLFAFLPDFGTVQGLFVVIDILLIVFTHIKTIRVVAQLMRGHLVDDEEVKDRQMAQRMQRACLCGCCAAVGACFLRAVDAFDRFMRKHRTLVIKIVTLGMRVLVALIVAVVFVLGMYLLAEIAASLITMQAFDGAGIITAIASPVTLALGSANVKSIENARVANTQTLLQLRNNHNRALFEIAVLTNEFNDGESRQIGLFNSEYCQFVELLFAGGVACDRVEQRIAEFDPSACPYFENIVPRLYADVDRQSFRRLVVSSLSPFVAAARNIVLDFIWFVGGVVIVLGFLIVCGQIMYRALVLIRMVRVRKRLVFENERALQKTFTTRKDGRGDKRVLDKLKLFGGDDDGVVDNDDIEMHAAVDADALDATCPPRLSKRKSGRSHRSKRSHRAAYPFASGVGTEMNQMARTSTAERPARLASRRSSARSRSRRTGGAAAGARAANTMPLPPPPTSSMTPAATATSSSAQSLPLPPPPVVAAANTHSFPAQPPQPSLPHAQQE